MSTTAVAPFPGVRYYDPTTGTFLTRDPIEAITRSPYAYVDGNPLNMVDPSGLCGWSDPWGCANDAAEFVGGLVPEEVRDADLGEFDWGTAAASGVNIVWGTQKMATGAVIIGTGTVAIPFTSGISGPPAYIFGGYQLLTGGAKFYRGTQQFTQVISEPCEDEEDQRLGANASRFWKGVTPNFDNVIDFLGGLPV